MGVEDLPTVLFAIFASAILAIFAMLIVGTFAANITPKIAQYNPAVASNYQTGVSWWSGLLDIGIGILAIGLSAGMLAVAFISRSYPFFAPIAFLVQAAMLILAWALQGAFSSFISDANIAAVAASFPITLAILSNFTLFTLLVSTLIIILNYIKPSPYIGVNA
jgi:hypothetical protein